VSPGAADAKRRSGGGGFAAQRLLGAVRFAAEQHRDDRRKGETAAPYINHPITVAEQLAAHDLGADVELLMAAVLHDVIEDTDATYDGVRHRFGARVADMVQEVSDDKTLEKDARRRLAVDTIAHKSREARLIKLSDMIANVHDVIHHPPQWTLERKLNYVRWAERMAAAIAGTHASLEKALAGEIAAAHKALAAAPLS